MSEVSFAEEEKMPFKPFPIESCLSLFARWKRHVGFQNIELMLSNAYSIQEINKGKGYTAFTSLEAKAMRGLSVPSPEEDWVL